MSFVANHPFLVVLAFILIIAVLKGWLPRLSAFKGNKKIFVTPIIIILAIIIIFTRPLLSIIGMSAGMLAALFVFIALGWMIMAAMGVNAGRVGSVVKEVGFLKLTVIIVVVAIFALSISQVFGDKLLEEPTISFSDGIIHEPEPKEVDLSFLFTRKFLGIMAVLITLGSLFVFVNLS